MIILPTSYMDRSLDEQYYIVHTDRDALLAGNPSKQLGLIKRIHAIEEVDRYPELKQTTATLPGTYNLEIDPTVKPVVHGTRRQPLALLRKIKSKLEEMEQAGHIAKVTEPTDWDSSLVVVVKGEKIRLCIDPKDLNRAIRRKHYPIPTVEEVVASIPRAKVSSVFDAKSGFLQIQLNYESSLLTTFNTPCGRYRWLRLVFGVKSAPDVFQCIMGAMLAGIENTRAIMDDVIIGARNEEHHDKILKQVVQCMTN